MNENKGYIKNFLIWISLFLFLQSTDLYADIMSPRYRPRCIDFDSKYVYIGTTWGFNVFDKKENRWIDLDFEISEKKTVVEKNTWPPSVLSILSDSEWVWLGLWERCIIRINKITGKIERAKSEGFDLDTFHPLPKSVVEIKKDKKGDIWLANPYGITKYDGKKWLTIPSYRIYYYSGAEPAESELGVHVTSIAVDSNNRLWIGTSNFYFAYYEYIEGLRDEDIKGGVILYDGNELRYVYTHNYNLKKEDSLHIKTPLLSNDVRCVEIDGDNVWIGTANGLSVYNSKTNKWKNYDKKDYKFLKKGISSIAITPDFIWVGCYEGIARLDKKEDRWFILGEDILAYKPIASIAYDPYENSIWAVTPHHAYRDVYVYRYKQNDLTIFPTRKRVIIKDPEELFNFGKFFEKIKYEGKAIFKEFLEKYPEHEKVQQVRHELLRPEDEN